MGTKKIKNMTKLGDGKVFRRPFWMPHLQVLAVRNYF